MTTVESTDYDIFPYESQPYADSRPEHCALIAQLRGFSPPALNSFRCLEIGCARGNNILPLALLNPSSSFVGIDSAESQIEQANGLVQRLSLSNIEFRHAQFEQLGSELGTFDYIICHGVLSWIPTALHAKLHSFCVSALREGGILYLSYNTYPGWHIREVVRNALMFHTAELPLSDAKVDQARQFASFLSQHVQGVEFQDTALLRNEFRKASQLPGWYLMHDLLEGENVPLYFSDVVNALFDVGLRYVGDAELGMMFPQEFSQEVRKKLYTIGSSPEMLEQYLDFLRMRTFRKSIFIRSEAEASKQLESAAVGDMFVGTSFRRQEKTTRVRASSAIEFINAQGDTYEASDPLIQQLLSTLASVSPAFVQSDELFQKKGITESNATIENFQKTLLRLYLEGIVELSLAPLKGVTTISDQPRGSQFARIQAEAQDEVINLRHEVVELDDLSRNILMLADGGRTRSQIAEELEKRGVRALRDGIKVTLPEAVQVTLEALARECLLEG